MALDDRHQRFARHLLLPEIGVEGQDKLCAATAFPTVEADPTALEAARTYLTRAGLAWAGERPADAPGSGHAEVVLPEADAVDVLAGHPALREAAAALAGAFAAVETIKRVAGVGEAGALPPGLCLGEARDPEE